MLVHLEELASKQILLGGAAGRDTTKAAATAALAAATAASTVSLRDESMDGVAVIDEYADYSSFPTDLADGDGSDALELASSRGANRSVRLPLPLPSSWPYVIDSSVGTFELILSILRSSLDNAYSLQPTKFIIGGGSGEKGQKDSDEGKGVENDDRRAKQSSLSLSPSKKRSSGARPPRAAATATAAAATTTTDGTSTTVVTKPMSKAASLLALLAPVGAVGD